MDPTVYVRPRAILFFALFALVLGCFGLTAAAHAFTWPWDRSDPWPSGSDIPVTVLDHPAMPARFPTDGGPLPPVDHRLYRFAVYGDQRALADGEWQKLITLLARKHTQTPLLFVIDTGDLVYAGQHGNQFDRLHQLLKPIADLPYLVCVGNHELHNNKLAVARDNTASFLGYLDEDFSSERMFYRKDIGPVTYIFLNTNDLLYGDSGTWINSSSPAPGSRAETQMKWLAQQLAPSTPREETMVVVMHHPFVQSSHKHESQAQALWSYRYRDRRLPDILADGRVDLIITGHTHTYERFRLERNDGQAMDLVNFSGRPRTSFLWMGAGARRAHDITGQESAYLTERGWENLEGWRITQIEAMIDKAANQCGLFTLFGDGHLQLEVYYLDEDAPSGYRTGAPIVF